MFETIIEYLQKPDVISFLTAILYLIINNAFKEKTKSDISNILLNVLTEMNKLEKDGSFNKALLEKVDVVAKDLKASKSAVEVAKETLSGNNENGFLNLPIASWKGRKLRLGHILTLGGVLKGLIKP